MVTGADSAAESGELPGTHRARVGERGADVERRQGLAESANQRDQGQRTCTHYSTPGHSLAHLSICSLAHVHRRYDDMKCLQCAGSWRMVS